MKQPTFIRLTYDEQLEKHKQAKAGDINARNELVESMMPLAYKICEKFYRVGRDASDIKAEAAMAVIYAVDHWNPEKGKLTTYSSMVVGCRLKTVLQIPTGPIYIPPATVGTYKKGKASPKQLRKVENALKFNPKANIENISQNIASEIDYELVNDMLDGLDNKDKELIKSRFGIDTKKIGNNNCRDILGISHQAFYAKCGNILRILRANFGDLAYD